VEEVDEAEEGEEVDKAEEVEEVDEVDKAGGARAGAMGNGRERCSRQRRELVSICYKRA
jgi:hypothetical protein